MQKSSHCPQRSTNGKSLNASKRTLCWQWNHRCVPGERQTPLENLRCDALCKCWGSAPIANLRLTGRVYTRLGRAQAQRGRITEALATLRTALKPVEEQQDVWDIAEVERRPAALSVAQQQSIAVAPSRH